MKPINECKTVAELLCDESRWIKGHIASDAIGRNVEADNGSACCWCLFGAICRIYGDGDWRGEYDKLKPYTDNTPIRFNEKDTTTFADIRRVIEAAGV